MREGRIWDIGKSLRGRGRKREEEGEDAGGTSPWDR
jgi:hypothetical protein